MAMPSTLNYCSLLDKHYGLTSLTHWQIWTFITLKVTVVTDSYRDTKSWLKLSLSGPWRWTEAWDRQCDRQTDRQWQLSWDYREQQTPTKTDVCDTIQYIQMPVGFLVHQEFQVPVTPPLHMANLPQLCLRLILLPSPCQKWQQSPKAAPL